MVMPLVYFVSRESMLPCFIMVNGVWAGVSLIATAINRLVP